MARTSKTKISSDIDRATTPDFLDDAKVILDVLFKGGTLRNPVFADIALPVTGIDFSRFPQTWKLRFPDSNHECDISNATVKKMHKDGLLNIGPRKPGSTYLLTYAEPKAQFDRESEYTAQW